MTRHKNFLTKRSTNKVFSSLLDNSNDAGSKSEEFKDTEVFADSEEQHWFKQAHVGKFLGIEDIQTSLNSLEKCKKLTRQELVPSQRGTLGWPGLNKIFKYIYQKSSS